MSTLNLTNLLAGQVTSYGVYDDNYNIETLKKINFITAANGLFRVEKTPTAIFKTLVEEYKKPIPGLNLMSEGPELLVPKIPFRFLQMALSFYLDVYDKDKTEASLLFFWNKDNVRLPEIYSDNTPVKGLISEGQLVVYVPRQKNSAGLSEFHMDPMVDWLRNNLSLFAETHSHHSMSAFFSSTDDANENATQFYGVWGKIKNQQPEFAFRYCSGDSKTKICPSVLFEWPEVTTTKTYEVTSDVPGFQRQQFTEVEKEVYKGPFEKLEYPADWMEQHTKAVVANKFKSTYPVNTTYPSRYLSNRDGSLEKMEQLDMEYYGDYYDQALLDPFAWETQETEMNITGFEDAEIIQFIDKNDEKNKQDIQDNLIDITSEYTALGYKSVIESAIDGAKQSASL
ncbi:hypothetical protein ABFV99_13885 [Cytobacillus horneckiae]|uniref:hypothetical protein n=1 Tax=Cytobacillus horneckiae TaxID=549687 RepID=UPI0034CFECAC